MLGDPVQYAEWVQTVPVWIRLSVLGGLFCVFFRVFWMGIKSLDKNGTE